MRTAIKSMTFVCFLVFVCGAALMGDISPDMTFVRSAEAVVGAPLTPVSAAGVARRTTRRVVAAEAAVVTTTAAKASAASAAPKPAAPPAPPAATGVPIGTVVPALPGGCVAVVIGGASYSDCSGTFYKQAFQGNNLVYVVVPKPMP